MNKHPSCNVTWEETTRMSLEISLGMSALFASNVHLERAILAEFEGRSGFEETVKMVASMESAHGSLERAGVHLQESIRLGEEKGNPYLEEITALEPIVLAQRWEASGLIVQCGALVRAIGAEIQMDHLSTMRRFVGSLVNLRKLTDETLNVLRVCQERASEGTLRQALEYNEVPLQETFAELLAHWLQFTREYLVESLLATEATFRNKGIRSLKAA